MKKSFLKTVAMVIAIVLCVGIFPFSFGCAKTEETPEIYLTVSDNIKNNSFAMGRDYEPHERILTYYLATVICILKPKLSTNITISIWAIVILFLTRRRYI